MSQNSGNQSGSLVFGFISMIIGGYIIFVSADIIAVSDSLFYAPRWVVGLAGLIFFLGGISLSFQDSRFSAIFDPSGIKLFYNAVGVGLFVLFLIISNWVAFGAGLGQDDHDIYSLFIQGGFRFGAIILDLISLIFLGSTIKRFVGYVRREIFGELDEEN